MVNGLWSRISRSNHLKIKTLYYMYILYTFIYFIYDLYSVMLPVCRELNEITIICPWRSFNIKDQVHLIILKKLAATRQFSLAFSLIFVFQFLIQTDDYNQILRMYLGMCQIFGLLGVFLYDTRYPVIYFAPLVHNTSS